MLALYQNRFINKCAKKKIPELLSHGVFERHRRIYVLNEIVKSLGYEFPDTYF